MGDAATAAGTRGILASLTLIVACLAGASDAAHHAPGTIEGGAQGIFLNPRPSGAVVRGVGENSFGWGAPFESPPSELNFVGSIFTAQVDTLFEIGELCYFNGSIAVGTGADFVDFVVTARITNPVSAALTFTQTFRLINTPNTGDPEKSADVVFLPLAFPTETLDIDGEKYSMSMMFGEAAGSGSTTLDKFSVNELTTACTKVQARIFKACVVPGGGKPILEEIVGVGKCGGLEPEGPRTPTWGSFGQRPVLRTNAGEELRVECTQASFKMYYSFAGGPSLRVGKCPFDGGCNTVHFWHAGDVAPADDLPDCLVRTRWLSKDYGAEMDQPNPWTGTPETGGQFINWAETVFGALSKSVVKSNYKFGVRQPYPIPDYLCNGGEFAGEPAEADMRAVSTVSVDPLLGPETEAFFDLVQSRFELLPPTGMMEGSAAKRCDLDGDDDCDRDDVTFFGAAVGSCRGDVNYLPRADGDADGCVSEDDGSYVFTADALAPHLEVSSATSTLWPPNHRLVPIRIEVFVADDQDRRPTVVLLSVTSNEPDARADAGDVPADIVGAAVGTDDREFRLRAERAGKGTGRVYTATYAARDASGNVRTASVTFAVPHDQRVR